MTRSSHSTFKSLLLAATILAVPLIAVAPSPAAAQLVVGLSVQIAPPLLPVYIQPPIPEVGYMWTPGYWAYEQTGYYWVPGTWIQPPTIGVLWTPPYWGWIAGAYLFHDGYWGPHVGFYGGVNYGFGYGGSGYEGGHWDGGNFAYNRSANNFGSVNVQNVYEKNVTVINNSNVSYVGGADGLRTEPTAEERSAENDRHIPATAMQTTHVMAAASNPALAASHNNGHPPIGATSRPAQADGVGTARPVPATAVAHTTEPVGVAHPAERAAEPAAAAHPAEHALESAAVTQPVAHAAEPATAHPAAARPAEHLAAASAPPPAVVHAVARPVAPAASRPAVVHAVARPVAPAAVHPAAAHVAAPHAAPAPQAKPEEKK